MSENLAGHTPAEKLHALCEQAAALVGNLPGPMHRVAVRSGDCSVEVEWPPPDQVAKAGSARPIATSTLETREPNPIGVAPEAAAIEPGHVVRSPLVGTLYRSPQPGHPPYVNVGDVVEAGETVAIVEAMKLMNTVTTEVAGRVVEIYVDNEEPVEFEQPLLRIAPAMHVAPDHGQQVA